MTWLREFKGILPQPGELVLLVSAADEDKATLWLDGAPVADGASLRLLRPRLPGEVYRRAVLVRVSLPRIVRPGAMVVLTFTNGDERAASMDDRFERSRS